MRTVPSPPNDVEPIRVLAPDARRLSADEIVRLLGGARSGTAAWARRGRQMVAVRGAEPVGVAAFELDADDLVVHALAAVGDDGRVIGALAGALELACLAAGGRRVLVPADGALEAALVRLGYRPGLPGRGWLARWLA